MQNRASGPKSRRRLRSVAGLTDDLISEILARVPYSSLCRFKCVSTSWLALCSSPSLIRRTLSGFFFGRNSAAHFRFVSTLGLGRRRFPLMEGPLFSFLPAGSVNIDIVDNCNGLLLFDRHRCMYNMHGSSRYFVCNPATGNWINLPDIESMGGFRPPVIRLGFDPAESCHFRAFLLVHQAQERPLKVAGVQIYSSETRSWTYRQSGWGADIFYRYQITTAFFNGTLHLATSGPSPSIVTVDKDGKTWRTIPAPRHFVLMGLSRGCFYAVGGPEQFNNGRCLSIWALEDCCDGHEEWILKHTTKPFAPLESYVVRAIHPEDTLIFLIKTVGGTAMRNALVSYDFMNSKEHTIKTLEQSFEEETLDYPYTPQPYPYMPCFSKWPLSDGQ